MKTFLYELFLFNILNQKPMKQTIVIITEDSAFSKLLEPLLNVRSQDIRVVICQSGEEIEETLSSFHCELVLIDGALKNMCCCDIIQYLNRKALFHIGIWFFTDTICKDYRYKLKALGVNRILCKSISQIKLNNEIASLFVSAKNEYVLTI